MGSSSALLSDGGFPLGSRVRLRRPIHFDVDSHRFSVSVGVVDDVLSVRECAVMVDGIMGLLRVGFANLELVEAPCPSCERKGSVGLLCWWCADCGRLRTKGSE